VTFGLIFEVAPKELSIDTRVDGSGSTTNCKVPPRRGCPAARPPAAIMAMAPRMVRLLVFIVLPFC
jgi:hypothetical protein